RICSIDNICGKRHVSRTPVDVASQRVARAGSAVLHHDRLRPAITESGGKGISRHGRVSGRDGRIGRAEIEISSVPSEHCARLESLGGGWLRGFVFWRLGEERPRSEMKTWRRHGVRLQNRVYVEIERARRSLEPPRYSRGDSLHRIGGRSNSNQPWPSRNPRE